MSLPQEGMQIFPRRLWDGLTPEILNNQDFRGAGPETTRRLINEILGLQNYLTRKLITLPALNMIQGNGSTYESIICYMMGNCIQLQIHNALFPEDPQAYAFAWDIDLSEHLPGIDSSYLVGIFVDPYGATAYKATLAYYPDQKLLAYHNDIGIIATEQRDLFNNFYLI